MFSAFEGLKEVELCRFLWLSAGLKSGDGRTISLFLLIFQYWWRLLWTVVFLGVFLSLLSRQDLWSSCGALTRWRIDLFTIGDQLNSTFRRIIWDSSPGWFPVLTFIFPPLLFTFYRRIPFFSSAQLPFPHFFYFSPPPSSWDLQSNFSFTFSLTQFFLPVLSWLWCGLHTIFCFPPYPKTNKLL